MVEHYLVVFELQRGVGVLFLIYYSSTAPSSVRIHFDGNGSANDDDDQDASVICRGDWWADVDIFVKVSPSTTETQSHEARWHGVDLRPSWAGRETPVTVSLHTPVGSSPSSPYK